LQAARSTGAYGEAVFSFTGRVDSVSVPEHSLNEISAERGVFRIDGSASHCRAVASPSDLRDV